MSAKIKQTIAKRYQALFQSLLQDSENKDEIQKNCDEMIARILDSRSLPDLESAQEEWSKRIETKQFFCIDFDFNNAILGRAKPFYTQTGFHTDYQKHYNPRYNWADLSREAGQASDPLSISTQFCEKWRRFDEFCRMEKDLDLGPLIQEGGVPRAVVESGSMRNSVTDNLLQQLFLLFLVSSSDSPALLKNYIVSLASLANYFINIRKIGQNGCRKLFGFLAALAEACSDKVDFVSRLLTLIHHHMGSADLTSELGLLLGQTLLFVFENTSYGFLRKVAFDPKSSPELPPLADKQLAGLKEDMSRVLQNPNCFQINHKLISGMTNTIFYLLNIKKSGIVVFDENMTLRSAKRRFDPETTVLIVNECQSNPNFLILNEVFSSVGFKLFLGMKAEGLDTEENFTEGGFIRRRSDERRRSRFKQHIRRNAPHRKRLVGHATEAEGARKLKPDQRQKIGHEQQRRRVRSARSEGSLEAMAGVLRTES